MFVAVWSFTLCMCVVLLLVDVRRCALFVFRCVLFVVYYCLFFCDCSMCVACC